MDAAESSKTPILDKLRRTGKLEKYILAVSWEEKGQLFGMFIRRKTMEYFEAKIDSRSDPYMKHEPFSSNCVERTEQGLKFYC